MREQQGRRSPKPGKSPSSAPRGGSNTGQELSGLDASTTTSGDRPRKYTLAHNPEDDLDEQPITSGTYRRPEDAAVCEEVLQAKLLGVCFCLCLVVGTTLGLIYSEEITRAHEHTRSPTAAPSPAGADSGSPVDDSAAAGDAPQEVKVNPLLAFCLLAFFLLIGTVVRIYIRIFASLFLPASVIGGFLLFFFGQLWSAAGGTAEYDIVADGWRQVPPFAINIVFATLFLGRHVSSPRKVWYKCNTQFVYGQLLGWGQYIIGISWGTCLSYMFGLNRSFGLIHPVGFEGGYSTSLGLEESFINAEWREGTDLAVTSSTTGLLSGTLMGIGLINWYHRRRKAIPQFEYVPMARSAEVVRNEQGEYELQEYELREVGGNTAAPQMTAPERERLREERLKEMQTLTFFPLDRQGPSTYVVLQPVMVDNFSYHLCLTSLAVFFGYTAKSILATVDPAIEDCTGIPQFFRSFPTFPFSLLGGLLLQLILQKSDSMEKVDRHTFERLHRMALDFLIVSAIASVHAGALIEHLGPFVLLMIVAIVYHFVMAVFVAKRFFGDAEGTFWFERAIVEMGQSMGDTSTGILLLSIMDPTDHCGIAAIFAYSRLLYEPILGGGLWTSTVIPLCYKWGPWPLVGIALVVWCSFFFVWYKWVRPRFNDRATLDRLDRVGGHM